LVFTSQAGGVLGLLFWKPADGSGDAERLTDGQQTQRVTDALPDGSGVLFSDGNSIQMAKFDRGPRVEFVIPPSPRRAAGSGVLSPDGRWLAYGGRELGSSPQVFVSPFPRADEGRTLVSRDGGTQPRWSRDGRELFFVALDGTLMGAPV